MEKNKVKAVIKIDAPKSQIGQEVTIHFNDGTVQNGKCEAVKAREYPEKLLPCKCGCKYREHWYGANSSDNAYILKCHKCGFRASGKNEIDLHKNWNRLVKEESE